jgi:hypothetical protein
MISIPLAKEYIIKHFPQFEGFQRIQFARCSFPTEKQLEDSCLSLELPSTTIAIPKMEKEEMDCIMEMNPNANITVVIV